MTASVVCEDFSSISKKFGLQSPLLAWYIFFWRHLYISCLFILIFCSEFLGKPGRDLSSVADPLSHLVDPPKQSHFSTDSYFRHWHSCTLPITVLPNPNKYLCLATVFHYLENLNTSVMNPVLICKTKKEMDKERVKISLLEWTLHPPVVNN